MAFEAAGLDLVFDSAELVEAELLLAFVCWVEDVDVFDFEAGLASELVVDVLAEEVSAWTTLSLLLLLCAAWLFWVEELVCAAFDCCDWLLSDAFVLPEPDPLED